MHALSKEIEHYVNIKYWFTIVNDFVHLVHPKPVQNIVTIKPPWMYSVYNDVTYFRRLGEFDNGRSVSLQKSLNVSFKRLKKQYLIENSLKTSETHVKYVERCWQWSDSFSRVSVCYSPELTMSMSILQVNVNICMETFLATLSTNCFFLIHT